MLSVELRHFVVVRTVHLRRQHHSPGLLHVIKPKQARCSILMTRRAIVRGLGGKRYKHARCSLQGRRHT